MVDRSKHLKLILILGPWGSGSSALAGALHHSGLSTAPPHIMTTDERTPNSFESVEFRRIVLRCVNEKARRVNPLREALMVRRLAEMFDRLAASNDVSHLGNGKAVVALKLPAASLIVPQIGRILRLTMVVMDRSLDDIERTRRRRGWNPAFGRDGAAYIYDRLRTLESEPGMESRHIDYDTLVSDPSTTLDKVSRFCGLEACSPRLDMERARNFIRPA